MGSVPAYNKPIKINGAIHIHAGICPNVVASAAEAELGALFYNCQNGKIHRLTLEELGHTQPPTPIHCDNETAVGIANNTVKKQRSRAMEMRYFWIVDQVAQKQFNIAWHPGQENLADYFTKHFDSKHHQQARPWYIWDKDSQQYLPRALAPRSLKGCIRECPSGYTRNIPLPRLRTDSRSLSQPVTFGAAQ